MHKILKKLICDTRYLFLQIDWHYGAIPVTLIHEQVWVTDPNHSEWRNTWLQLRNLLQSVARRPLLNQQLQSVAVRRLLQQQLQSVVVRRQLLQQLQSAAVVRRQQQSKHFAY
jgi:hypothetical protein